MYRPNKQWKLQPVPSQILCSLQENSTTFHCLESTKIYENSAIAIQISTLKTTHFRSTLTKSWAVAVKLFLMQQLQLQLAWRSQIPNFPPVFELHSSLCKTMALDVTIKSLERVIQTNTFVLMTIDVVETRRNLLRIGYCKHRLAESVMFFQCECYWNINSHINRLRSVYITPGMDLNNQTLNSPQRNKFPIEVSTYISLRPEIYLQEHRNPFHGPQQSTQ